MTQQQMLRVQALVEDKCRATAQLTLAQAEVCRATAELEAFLHSLVDEVDDSHKRPADK